MESTAADNRHPLLALLDHSMAPAVGCVIAVIALFEVSSLDLWVQDHFYDFVRNEWLIDVRWVWWRRLLHDWPTALISAIGGGLLVLLLATERWRRFGSQGTLLSRRAVLCALLTLGSIPGVVAIGKKTTNIFCPSETRRYGGDVCYVRLTRSYPIDDQPNRRGQCFPGGHASGGFALMGLCSLMRRRRAQGLAVMAGIGFGGLMGTYQILTGAHFLSDTLVAFGIAWWLCAWWRRVLGLVPARGPAAPISPQASTEDYDESRAPAYEGV